MHSTTRIGGALAIALALGGGCDGHTEALDDGFGDDGQADEEPNDGRGRPSTHSSTATKSEDKATGSCDASGNPSSDPNKGTVDPGLAPTTPVDAHPGDPVDHILQNFGDPVPPLEAACAQDQALDLECEQTCFECGFEWNPGGTIGVDPQSVTVTVGDLVPDGVCEDGSEAFTAVVSTSADCVCICGAPLPPEPPPPPGPPGLPPPN